ncbi:variant erythrocyte surface antigen-1 alpha subunit [Babesia bovis T2Bo]|uniref:Variant erythrocyte surface antigen-1, alpha subunit n=2 Tax=Babesia bovis TaxID=5865 RepID=A7AR31_BABBO|nr:variant erythrocyte surface antigen-1 alpha subunit [Babesia bovis T2Bo]EDO07000.1 variant erythrocyte surface antigen-1 alpha subunit [Babesia bovis T2Bo]|eukprot:XP_001610568.1 variant erythrocyte surface antigen-1, alpha subunit [Babesia bovis T2Bo]
MSAPGTSTWPYNSLTTPPTNLKEAIDWVLRVTGKDGKELNKDNGECICGLAAAVTDLLQSVQLEYNGYQGESNGAEKNNGPPKGRVTECLNGLFSLVQGLGGTAVVRTYIDQLAQVLSALVGWSRIDKCPDKGTCQKGVNGYQHGTKDGCKYLKDVEENKPCTDCGCMKWNVSRPDDEGTPLGRKCTRCSDSGDSDSGCKCGTSGGGSACSPDKCQCALAGKCCKCCCTGCTKCKKECICYKENASLGIYEHKESYVSAYKVKLVHDGYFGREYQVWPKWSDRNTSKKRALGARILLGSVCLIWSGITYMYWTGKYHSSSPRWNNHILDGSGLDDGTLSQWLQALGFPRGMINNSGPRNRWDAVIWDGIRGMLYLGFPETGNGGTAHGGDYDANTFRQPAGMNYAGYIHTVDRGAFCSNATVFKNGDDSSTTDTNTHKCGALYKLYILSCAYFTGLQKKTTESTTSTTTNTPKTIREILYWLSALPYSQAYKQILEHSKGILERVAPDVGDKKQLSFYQTGRSAPITVHEYNLFAHFQAVTQYCPLVLIGIQGGLKGTNSTGPAIHSLYSNSHFSFTYPTVSIQAYNQVVHYIRALFYQLYFLRKQCAVKVAQGGKWRECRYGDGVLGKDVVSWMCLGCDPMEHDRKKRVGELEKILNGVPKGKSGDLPGALKDVLEKIGEVVVQLGNAQEALEGKKTEAIEGVKKKLEGAKTELGKAKGELETAVNGKDGLNGKLAEAKKKLVALTKGGGSGILKELEGALGAANSNDFDQGKNKISEAINGVRDALEALEKGVKDLIKKEVDNDKFALGVIFDPAVVTNEVENVIQQGVSQEYTTLLNAINNLLSICNSPKCSACDKHSTKCGQKAESTICEKCLQPTTTGVPSPLQAFLEDRLPGFSCDVVRNDNSEQPYPPAASHLGHCNGSGQCCPLPMGFRGHFQEGITHTGKRLYGILYFFSNENMMQSCVYTLVRVTAALSATTPQVLGDVFGFFRGGVGNKDKGIPPKGGDEKTCDHTGNPSETSEENKTKYFCGWCASGLRDEVKNIEWIPKKDGDGGKYRGSVGEALIGIKGDKGTAAVAYSDATTTTSSLSTLTEKCQYLSPLTGELYTVVSATFGGTYLSWVLYLSDALHSGLESLSEAFQQIECRGCKGQCDPNKCKKGEHGQGNGLCGCQSIVSCTGVLPVLYRHGFSYGNPFNLEGYQQKEEEKGDYSIENTKTTKRCHEFLDSLNKVLEDKQATSQDHPLTNLLSQVGKLQYDIRLPWIFVLTLAWLVAVLYLAFGAIWPLDWAHMRSHWLRGGEHQWQCMWYKVMTGRKGVELMEYFGKRV